MSKKNKSVAKLTGSIGFEQYYGELYGNRWSALKKALLGEKNDIEWKAAQEKESYFLDKGSVLAAMMLPVENASFVLDMCAAPGGKTLVLATRMNETCKLVSNDRSKERMMRLKRVVENHLSERVLERVEIICCDGAKLCLSKQECYDAILLDAPCSSERHVLSSATHLAKWSPARIKSLAIEQWALLSSAYRLLRSNGYLLYATCALSPVENDLVVAKLAKKFSDVEYIKDLPDCNSYSFWGKDFPLPESTEFGFHVLPDICLGAGPLYFSLIHKR